MTPLSLLVLLLLPLAAAGPGAPVGVRVPIVAVNDVPVCVEPATPPDQPQWSVGEPCGPASASVDVDRDGSRLVVTVCVQQKNGEELCVQRVLACSETPLRYVACWAHP